MRRIAHVGLAAAFALAALHPAAAAETPPPSLSITGEGIARATPDTAIVTAGVVSEAPTAGAALSDNNAAMGRLIETVKAAGIAERDVGTTGFSLEPVMVYPQPRDDGTQDPPRITGYRVANKVTVRIRNIAAAGELLDKVVRAGANAVEQVAFVVDDDKALLNGARAEAMRDALEKARIYAEAGGFTIGRILSIAEQGGGSMPVYAAPMGRMMASAAMEKVPLAVGEQELAISVSVTVEIRQP